MNDQEQRRPEALGRVVSPGYSRQKRLPDVSCVEVTSQNVAREIMRLEAVRQSLDDEILRLRRLQAAEVS